MRLLFAQSKAAIVEEGGNLWNNHPGQKNFTPLKLAEGYNTGPAKVAIVQVLKECEAEYQASGSVPDLFGRTKINPAWAD